MLVPPFDEGGIAVGVTGYAFRVVYLQGGHEEPFVKNGRDVEYLVLAILVSGAYSDPFFQRGEGLVVQAEFCLLYTSSRILYGSFAFRQGERAY